MTDDSEADLVELLASIRGEGRWALCPGISSYPKRPEENQRRIHAMCLELERRGEIKRKVDHPEHVLWVARAVRQPGTVPLAGPSA